MTGRQVVLEHVVADVATREGTARESIEDLVARKEEFHWS